MSHLHGLDCERPSFNAEHFREVIEPVLYDLRFIIQNALQSAAAPKARYLEPTRFQCSEEWRKVEVSLGWLIELRGERRR
jgi:hypothetical protein